MTHTLACGDVMPGCDAKFTADTEDEILAAAARHVDETHGISEISPEVLDAVKSAIKQS
jgi:predicted small metal-binding protein